MQKHLSHILVQHRYEAIDIQNQLKAGKDFASMARKFSICGSAAQGGYLGCVALSRLHPDFAEAARNLKEGELSEIVRTSFGHHLILAHSEAP